MNVSIWDVMEIYRLSKRPSGSNESLSGIEGVDIPLG